MPLDHGYFGALTASQNGSLSDDVDTMFSLQGAAYFARQALYVFKYPIDVRSQGDKSQNHRFSPPKIAPVSDIDKT
jgi:hypothetical protein